MGNLTVANVLLVTGIYPPDVGGPATFIYDFKVYLIDHGHAVRVVTLTNMASENGDPGVIRISRRYSRFVRAIKTIIRLKSSIAWADKILVNGLYEEFSIANFFHKKRFIAKIVGDPIWERYRNSNKENSLGIEPFQNLISLKISLQRAVFRFSIKSAQIITTPGESLSRIIEGWGLKKPILIINNGTYCREKQKLKDKFDLVSISRLVKWKNIDILIRETSSLGINVAIVGDGPERKFLEKLANHDCSTTYTFFGNLPSQSVHQIMDSSRVYALISSYEGLSFSLIEAMSIGMPIITSNIPANTKIIQNGFSGLVVDVDKANEFRDTLSRLLSDEELARNLSKNALNVARVKYCRDIQFKKFMEILLSI